MRRLSFKLTLLLILAALLPLTLYGMASIWTSRRASYRLVAEGNLNVARRAAEQIELYVANDLRILRALAENLSRIGLQSWQKEAIVRNYALNFDELRSIQLVDTAGRQVVSSLPGAVPAGIAQAEAFRQASRGASFRSEVRISEDFVPFMTLAVPVKQLNAVEGVLLAEVNLLDMWRLVDDIRIGQQGYALVVSRTGQLIAHGHNEAKAGILRQENLQSLSIVQSVLGGKTAPQVYRNLRGIEVLGVGTPIRSLGWGVIIEQPTAEAYAAPRRMTSRLMILAVLSLLLMAAVGSWGGRRQIVRPIRALIQGAQRVGSGELGERVEIATGDELSQLGEAFNQMMEQLQQLQADIRRNERMVTFGRIAAGLVHDLRHPLRNVENSSQLLLRMFDDPQYRQIFQQTVEREFANLNRFLDDLHNLARPIPLRPIRLDLNQLVREILALYEEEAQRGGIRLIADYHLEGLRVEADRFAMERALKNLITNALQAMHDGGELRVSLRTISTGIRDQGSGVREADPRERIPENFSWAEIAIQDTGCGIPPERLQDLFVEYATTKRKGLGLGLAITKKLLEEHGGTIEIESRLGEGSCFRLRLPLPPNGTESGRPA